MSGFVYRRAARVILFDPSDRVLLSYNTWNDGQWWITPGGGLEASESPAEAALREIREETGFLDVTLGPVVVRHRFQWRFRGVDMDQDEWIFVGRTAGGEPDSSGLNDEERPYQGGYRWWPAAELPTVAETIRPLGLPAMVASLLADGPPATPWVVGTAPR